MKLEVVKAEKHEVQVELDNVTVAEVLRVYLYENGADFAAWKREHPSKPLVFNIKSDSGVKKAVSDAVSAIKKDCDKIVALLKK